MFGAGSGWRGAKERGPARRGAVPRCWLALGGGQEGVCGQPERTVTGRGSAGQGCGASGARSDRTRRGRPRQPGRACGTRGGRMMLEAERARVVCVAVTWAGLCWALRGGRWAGVCRDEKVRWMFGANGGWREGRQNAARRGGGRCREAGSRSAVGSKAGSRRGRSQAAARRGRGVERRVRGATACGAGEGGWQSRQRGGEKPTRDALPPRRTRLSTPHVARRGPPTGEGR